MKFLEWIRKLFAPVTSPHGRFEKMKRDYRRWAKRLRQNACVHQFMTTVSWTGRAQFCTKCHLTKDFVAWSVK